MCVGLKMVFTLQMTILMEMIIIYWNWGYPTFSDKPKKTARPGTEYHKIPLDHPNSYRTKKRQDIQKPPNLAIKQLLMSIFPLRKIG
jgi:hypothetical protein